MKIPKPFFLFRYDTDISASVESSAFANKNKQVKKQKGDFMKKTTVVILFGGRSAEYEVSLQSAGSVIETIDAEKYRVVLIGITRKGVRLKYNGDVQCINDTWHKHPLVFLLFHQIPVLWYPCFEWQKHNNNSCLWFS